jgi:hypothetical protein
MKSFFNRKQDSPAALSKDSKPSLSLFDKLSGRTANPARLSDDPPRSKSAKPAAADKPHRTDKHRTHASNDHDPSLPPSSSSYRYATYPVPSLSRPSAPYPAQPSHVLPSHSSHSTSYSDHVHRHAPVGHSLTGQLVSNSPHPSAQMIPGVEYIRSAYQQQKHPTPTPDIWVPPQQPQASSSSRKHKDETDKVKQYDKTALKDKSRAHYTDRVDKHALSNGHTSDREKVKEKDKESRRSRDKASRSRDAEKDRLKQAQREAARDLSLERPRSSNDIRTSESGKRSEHRRERTEPVREDEGDSSDSSKRNHLYPSSRRKHRVADMVRVPP